MWQAAAIRIARDPVAAAFFFATITCASPVAPTRSVTSDGEVVSLDPSVPTSRRVGAVLVAIDSSTLAPGHRSQATVTVLDLSGDTLVRATRRASWASTNPLVATVDAATGTITAQSVGTASIAATVGGATGRATIAVAEATPPVVSGVDVTLQNAQISLSQTTKASAVAHDSTGDVLTGRVIGWSSSDTSVAVVDASSGRVTPRAIGLAHIVATVDNVASFAMLTVSAQPPAAVASVNVALGNSALVVGQSTSAVAVARDSAGALLTGRQVKWSTSTVLVATIDSSSGQITARALGNAAIIATVDGVAGRAGLTVTAAPAPRVATVTVALDTASVGVGATTQATTVARDSAGAVLTDRPIYWSSSNPTVASVDGTSATVTGRGAGKAQIMAQVDGIVGTSPIIVLGPPPPKVVGVSVWLAHSTIQVGQTTTAWASAQDSAGAPLGRVPVWKTANAAVATVDSNGLVTARGQGTTKVIADVEGVTGQASVAVDAAPVVPVATIGISIVRTAILAGDTARAVVTARDAFGNVLEGRTVTWSASPAAVATIDASGLIIGCAPGNVIITATSEGASSSATLQVSAQLTFTEQPVSSTAGSAFAVTVAARNAQGITIPDYSGAVTLSLDRVAAPGARLSGTTTATATGGIVRFTGLSIDSAGTGYTLIATATGLNGATSNPFNVSAGSGADEPMDPGSGYLWTDNFDAYSSIGAMNPPPGISRYTKAYPINSLSLVPGRGGSGNATRVSVAASVTEFNAGAYTSPNNPSLATYDGALVWRYYFRLSPSFAVSFAGYKWMYAYYVGDNARTEIGPGGGTNARFQVNPGSGNFGMQPVGPYLTWTRAGQPAALNDGAWHRFTVYYKSTSSAGAHDGVVRVWIDGVKIIDIEQSTVGVTPPGGDRVWCTQAGVDAITTDKIHLFGWPGNYQAPPISFTQDYDDLKVWTAP